MRDVDTGTMAAEHDAAAAEYAAASAAYESALMSHDAVQKSATQERLRAAGDAYARTLKDLVAARRAAVPTFDELLRDSTMQADPGALVLESILAYALAEPASAGRPVSQAPVPALFAGYEYSATLFTRKFAGRRGLMQLTAEPLTAAS